jgi:hypothetical protein
MMDKKRKKIKQTPSSEIKLRAEGETFYIGLDADKDLDDKRGRPKGLTKRTIDRYKKVYRQFTIFQKKYTANKKSELYELCSTIDYDGATYSRKTIRNIIEDKRYNLKPSR